MLLAPPPPESVQFYAGCLVLALQRLHENGVVFRDLKPENVLLTAEGWPVLSDFGLVAFTNPPGANSEEDDEHPLTRDELHAKTMRGLAKREASTARKGKAGGKPGKR